MDFGDIVLSLQSGSGAAAERVQALAAAIQGLPQTPAAVVRWLNLGREPHDGLLIFVLLSIALIAGGHIGAAAGRRAARRQPDGTVAASRRLTWRYLAQPAGFVLGGLLVLVLTAGLEGPPRVAASSVFLSYALTYVLSGLSLHVIAGMLHGTSSVATEEQRRQIRVRIYLCYALPAAALAISSIMQMAGSTRDEFVLTILIFWIALCAVLLGLLLRLRRAQKLQRAVAGPLIEQDDPLMRLLSNHWFGLYVVLVALVFVVTLGAALIGQPGALSKGAMSLLLFAWTPLLMGLIGQWKQSPAETELDLELDPMPEREVSLWRHTVVHALRILLIIFACWLVTRIWGLDFVGAAQDRLGGRVVNDVIHVLVTLLLGYLVWEVIKTALDARTLRSVDARLGNLTPAEGEESADAEEVLGAKAATRLQTFAPLLRKTLFVVVVVLTGMLSLAGMGVDIGPLIAGAGVLGVAIGFGAQTLVRDIISGIFFLLDDAFRLGEYVEIEKTRGTVEGISIRSLRLRHQRGAVHTLPFGEIKQLTNYSRDWAVMRLEFLVAFDTDIEKVRKLVKKIGQEMLEDPTFGQGFIAPVKSQGVRDTTPYGLVIGVKYTTKPGQQFLVRKEVYRRVRDAFVANGVQFARPQIYVDVPTKNIDVDETERQRIGAAAASQIADGAVPVPAVGNKAPAS